jgi:hypothetical protein
VLQSACATGCAAVAKALWIAGVASSLLSGSARAAQSGAGSQATRAEPLLGMPHPAGAYVDPASVAPWQRASQVPRGWWRCTTGAVTLVALGPRNYLALCTLHVSMFRTLPVQQQVSFFDDLCIFCVRQTSLTLTSNKLITLRLMRKL